MNALTRAGTVDEALAGAFEVLGVDTLVAFVSTPLRWDVERIDAGYDPPSECFELVAFGEQGQLTWQRDIGGESGTALLLVVATPGEDPSGWRAEALRDDLDRLPHRHVLWGTTSPSKRAGCVRLGEGRIRGFDVPCAALDGKRLALESEELVGFDDDGNAYVLAERYLRLAPYGDTRERSDA